METYIKLKKNQKTPDGPWKNKKHHFPKSHFISSDHNNRGLLLGTNKLIALDTDHEKISDLIDQACDIFDSDTRIHVTPRGYHYIYRLNNADAARVDAGEWKKVIKADGKQLDILMGNAYLVSPHSIVDGILYKYRNNRIDIAPCPDWVRMLVVNPTLGFKFIEECMKVFFAEEGRGNDTLNICSYTVGGWVGAGELNEELAVSLLLKAALARGRPQGEAISTIVSGLQAGKDKPISIGPTRHQNLAMWLSDLIIAEIPHLTAVADTRGMIRSWMYWNDDGWQRMETPELERRAAQLLRPELDGNRRNIRSTVSECMVLIECEVPIVKENDWNAKKNYLPLLSGRAINLKVGTVDMIPRDEYMYKKIPSRNLCKWRKNLWGECLQRWFGSGYPSVLRLMGQALMGNPEQKFMFVQGIGGTGKTVFVDAIYNALGEWAGRLPIEYLVRSAGKYAPHPTGLQALEKKRIVVSGEVPTGRGMTWNEELLKNVSGSDLLTMRGMREDYREARMATLLIVYGNHRPDLRDVGESMRRRLVLVGLSNVIQEGERNRDLTDILYEERASVISSMVWGLRSYLKGGLQLSDEIVQDSIDYIDEEDRFGTVLGKCCNMRGQIGLDELVTVLMFNKFLVTSRTLAKMLRERNFRIKRGTGGKRVVLGLSVK